MLIKLILCRGVCEFEDKSISEESFKFADFFSFLHILQDSLAAKLLDSLIRRQAIESVAVVINTFDTVPKVSQKGLDPYNWSLPTSVFLRLVCLHEFRNLNLPPDVAFRYCLQSLNYEK